MRLGQRLSPNRWRPLDPATYEALVGLYRVRRHLESAQLRQEIRREAMQTRRELTAALHQLDQRDRR